MADYLCDVSRNPWKSSNGFDSEIHPYLDSFDNTLIYISLDHGAPSVLIDMKSAMIYGLNTDLHASRDTQNDIVIPNHNV